MKKLFAVVFVFALTFSIVYSFGDLSKSYLKAAKKAEQEKNYDEAIKYYKKIIKSDSSYNGSYWAIARIVEKQGNIQDAINWFKQSNEKGTKTMYAFIKIASYYKKLAKLAKTEDEKKQFVQKAIDAFELSLVNGNAKVESEDSIKSNKEVAIMNLAYLYYDNGRYEKAKKYAMDGMEYKDYEEAMLDILLNVYTETKSFDKAIETIDKRLRKDPKSLSLLKLKINVLNKMGRKQDVLNEMKKMEELGSDDSDVTSWLAQDAL
ncbi:tetratricopeptide repeat protein, partial [bacterium]|nr:tetratricopeptide repeat protein [bacterium]